MNKKKAIALASRHGVRIPAYAASIELGNMWGRCYSFSYHDASSAHYVLVDPLREKPVWHWSRTFADSAWREAD